MALPARIDTVRHRLTRLATLSHGSGRALTEILGLQLETAMAATELIRRPVLRDRDAQDAHRQMVEIEHRGDALRIDLVSALNRSLVTPLDREDLNRLSRSIDDVLDNVRDFHREHTMYGAPPLGSYPTLIDLTTDALRHLACAVAAIPHSPEAIMGQALPAKKACNRIRREYESSVAELFAGPLTMEVLKQRELLRRMDIVGLRLGEAIDTLADAAIKRGA